jgi:hypothetical protein
LGWPDALNVGRSLRFDEDGGRDSSDAVGVGEVGAPIPARLPGLGDDAE